ncbi:hypothetical protein ACJMK2_012579 [Sinanodonta woodiana]|uniref:Uncharacterized protein n=1 Tax=Sinanodonta woodiana TaxID=1069815 RepID=A0ABD3V8X7_SINWO
MPKGQDKTVKMPDDLDAPAILSLLKYCIWFRKDLPNTQILSDLIDFRNEVLLSGDLKVSDSDKDSKIDLMIQLLKDLKIHGDVISNLEKLKKEDIDITFRETEIRLLQELVSGLVGDISTVNEDMATMQMSVSDLSGNVDKMRDRNTETIGKVDALNTDVEGIRETMEERQEFYDKMVSFFAKNPDIHDKEITEKIQAIGKNIRDLRSNLTRVETEVQAIKARVSSLEKHREEINIEIKGIKEREEETNIVIQGIREQMEEQKKHETGKGDILI